MTAKANRCRKLRSELEQSLGKEPKHHKDEEDGKCHPPPQSYLSNSSKEVECLKHLHRAATQSAVLLSARNEYGTRKPLPTYLRPTLLPHPNLYDLKDLLQFVFRFVKHERLEEDQGQAAEAAATEAAATEGEHDETAASSPTCSVVSIASPNQSLAWRSGDSLDQSVLLTSLLLGAGYDAYVVVGTAPDWLRRGSTDSLRVAEDDDWRGGCGRDAGNAGVDGHTGSNRHGWRGVSFTKVPVVDCSKGVAGSRNEEGLHAWVMVRPGRRCDGVDDNDAASTIYADPAVGRIWPAEDSSLSPSPYISIQTIWNQSNQWVHLGDGKIPSYIDIEDETLWRPIYGNDGNGGVDSSSKLHVPASWAERIQMPAPYPPREHSFELYDKAKLELSTSSSNIICRKLTRYEDKERMEEKEAIEVFLGRSDHLLERHALTTPKQMLTEIFSEFHPLGLKRWSEILGVERTIEFHPLIRSDGLNCRTEYHVELKVEETFQDRPDRLTRRIFRVESISEGEYAQKGALILTKTDGEEIAVVEVEEHYGDTDEIKKRLEKDGMATDQIVTSRIFHMVENRISVTNISHDGVDVVSTTKIIEKEQADATARHAIGKDYDNLKGTESTTITKTFIAERDSSSSILSISEDIVYLSQLRHNEEQNWLLQQEDAPLRNSITAVASTEAEEESGANAEEHVRDYLAPFLIAIHDVDNLSSEETDRIKDACLEALKDRLLQRAQIMQSKLDAEKRKAEESRDSEGGDACAERIRVWEQRLEHHESLALEKYALMQEKLNTDVRLQRAAAY